MRKTDIDLFFTEAYEVRDEYNSRGVNEVKYNLKPSDNAYGDIIKKVQKMGHKKVISLKLDAEEVLGYTNLYIYEALLKYDGELHEGDVSELKDYVSLYCYDKYNKLSRDNGINYDYYYNKCSGKYERIITCEYSEERAELEECSNECGQTVPKISNKARNFIDTYITEDYLTPKQIEYCNTVLEYGPSRGGGIYDEFGNLLYTKQQANYYNNEIKARLSEYLVRNGQ
jgi:hypothetical protein